MSETGQDAEGEEQRGIFKRGDLYKMHTYCDAIAEASSVWALYPGTTMRFYQRTGTVAEAVAQLSDENLDGVGALPAVPTADAPVTLQQLMGVLLL